jgi:AmiR/NasT family two-component response regulator
MRLEAALESRVLIEQAKGMVAEHCHVSVDDVFTLLRGYARKHNRLLRQTAEAIIDGTLAAGVLAEPTLSRRT